MPSCRMITFKKGKKAMFKDRRISRFFSILLMTVMVLSYNSGPALSVWAADAAASEGTEAVATEEVTENETDTDSDSQDVKSSEEESVDQE